MELIFFWVFMGIPIWMWMALIAAIIYIFYGVYILKVGAPQNAQIRKLYPWVFTVFIFAFRDWGGRPVLEAGKARILRKKNNRMIFEMTNGTNMPVPDQQYFWKVGGKLAVFGRWVNINTFAPVNIKEPNEAFKVLFKQYKDIGDEHFAALNLELDKPTHVETDDPKMRSFIEEGLRESYTSPKFAMGDDKWKKYGPVATVAVVGIIILMYVWITFQWSMGVIETNAVTAQRAESTAMHAAHTVDVLYNMSQQQYPGSQQPVYNY